MSDPDSARRTRELIMLGGATAFLAVLPLALMLAPVPLAALNYRHGLRIGIIAAVLAGLFAAIITLNPVILAQVLLVLALGIAIGEGMRDGLKAGQIVALGAVVALVTTLLLMYVVRRVFGVDLVDMVGLFWEEALGAGSGNNAPDGETAEEIRRLIELQLAQMRMSLSASLVLGSLALSVVDFALVRWLLGKLGEAKEKLPGLPPFGRWRFPLWVGAVFVGARLIAWSGALGEGGGVFTWSIANLLLISGTLLGIHGAAVLWHFTSRISAGLRVMTLIVGIVVFPSAAGLALVIVGIVDSVFDLRRRRSARRV